MNNKLHESRSRLTKALPVLAAALLVPSFAGAVLIAADGWQVEVSNGPLTLSPTPGTVAFVFPGTTFPEDARGVAAPTAAGDAALFVGDYDAAKITAVNFAITSGETTVAKASRLILRSGSRAWYNYNVNTQPGVTTQNRVGFSLSDGWVTYDPSVTPESMAAAWSKDLQDVRYLGINIVKSDSRSEQQFTLSSFSLDGDRTPGELNPLEEALWNRFGVLTVAQVGAEQAAIDTDGDGLTDLLEIRAMFDAPFFKENFKISTIDIASGFTISWLAAEGKVYTVLRSSSMFADFEPVYQVTAASTGFEDFTDTDAAAGTEYFYRVVQQP